MLVLAAFRIAPDQRKRVGVVGAAHADGAKTGSFGVDAQIHSFPSFTTVPIFVIFAAMINAEHIKELEERQVALRRYL
jgi:hypothetical protein